MLHSYFLDQFSVKINEKFYREEEGLGLRVEQRREILERERLFGVGGKEDSIAGTKLQNL